VLVYLGCIALIGIPIMMAEVLIGRRGGQSPIHSMINLARAEGKSTGWQLAGWSGVLGSFIILSFYSVIAGWALVYVWYAASGVFSTATATPSEAAEAVGGVFGELLGNPEALLLWHTVFMVLTVLIVARGVRAGLERAVTYLMPALFVLLIFLVADAAISSGKFGEALAFLFQPDFSKLTTEAVLVALGHAFFTLSLGAGIMVAYGSYLPKHISIPRAAITVSVLDTVVALLAGLAIFPVVFAHAGLEPSAGPGLIFVTLPIAFGQMPLGTLFGTLFFVLLVFAALSSAISLLEPMVEYVQEHRRVRRVTAAVGAGVAVWLLGIVTVLSFNRWEELKFFGKTLFDLLDFLTANIMLPLTGLLLAVFAGWVMSKQATQDELEMQDGPAYRLWRGIIRYVTPVGVLIVFVYNLL
jgi:NSS family neurotransmitter:Na+ symporter